MVGVALNMLVAMRTEEFEFSHNSGRPRIFVSNIKAMPVCVVNAKDVLSGKKRVRRISMGFGLLFSPDFG
jgi:hypothetical protein